MIRTVISCSLFVSLVCLAAPASTQAEDNTRKEAGQGYVFAGIGAVNLEDSTIHFGGGGEVNLYKGLGFGVEIGYLSPIHYMGEGIGILSLDGQYTFGTGTPGKVRPFLTGGYTLAFRDGYANAINFGGGVHYWFSKRIGLRLEFRDHVSPAVWNAHAWQGRVGFDFR